MGRLIKRIAIGVFKGLKDLAPIATKEMKEAVINDAEKNDPFGKVIILLTEQITAKGGMIVIAIYIIDQIFNLGLFS